MFFFLLRSGRGQRWTSRSVIGRRPVNLINSVCAAPHSHVTASFILHLCIMLTQRLWEDLSLLIEDQEVVKNKMEISHVSYLPLKLLEWELIEGISLLPYRSVFSSSGDIRGETWHHHPTVLRYILFTAQLHFFLDLVYDVLLGRVEWINGVRNIRRIYILQWAGGWR